MQNYLLRNLSELAQKRAVLMREEAQLLDILARDLKREAGRREEAPLKRLVREPLTVSDKVDNNKAERILVRVPEAMRMIGIGRSAIYEEISAGRLKIKKSGRKTLIAVSDIQEWIKNLPERAPS